MSIRECGASALPSSRVRLTVRCGCRGKKQRSRLPPLTPLYRAIRPPHPCRTMRLESVFYSLCPLRLRRRTRRALVRVRTQRTRRPSFDPEYKLKSYFLSLTGIPRAVEAATAAPPENWSWSPSASRAAATPTRGPRAAGIPRRAGTARETHGGVQSRFPRVATIPGFQEWHACVRGEPLRD